VFKLVDVEIIERREKSVVARIIFPDGRVWQNTIGNGAMNGGIPKDWMLKKISEEVAPILRINEEESGSDGYVINAFEITSKIDTENISAYWIGGNLEGSDKFTVPRYIAKMIKSKISSEEIITSKSSQIVSSKKLSENLIEEFGLSESDNFNRGDALKSLLESVVNSQIEFNGYRGREGLAISQKPIEISGPYQLFRKYTWNVRKWNHRLVLQANTSTEIRSDQTLESLMNNDAEVEVGKRFTDITTGKQCYFRSISDNLVSESIDDEFFKGKSLNQYHSENLESESSTLNSVKVAYKETDEVGAFDHHPSLLVEICDPAAIPTRHSNVLRKHRYLDVPARMEHAFVIRNALSKSSSFCSISEHLVKPDDLGIDIRDFSTGIKNLEFGNGVRTGFSSGDIFSGFSRGGAAVKIERDASIGFIPCAGGSVRWSEMCSKLESYIQSNSDDPKIAHEDAWDPKRRVSRGDALHLAHHDLVVVEIPEYDYEYDNWKRACAQAGVELQVITTGKVADHFTWLNVAFGMIGKLGGAAFKLAGLKTDVDAWIGLDVSRRFGVNMGASSVVMNGEGNPIGWLDQVPMNREKFEDHEIRKILRDTYDGYLTATGAEANHICILRDGRWFAGSRAIKQIEEELNVKVSVVNIIKRGNFRLGSRNGGQISNSNQGVTLFDKDGTGYIQATSPRSGSPQLFKANIVHGDVDIEDLYHDLYWLTNSHIGSSLQIGVPSPVHFAHVISNMFRRNLLKNPDGFSTNLSFL
jgi:hypothetical protein